MGRECFISAGYIPVGMDHFALPDDTLAVAKLDGSLSRNFMGYTHSHEPMLIGLGASSISDFRKVFLQNEKEVEKYIERIHTDEFAFEKGHFLTLEDQVLRKHIVSLMCHYETTWDPTSEENNIIESCFHRLSPLSDDGLLVFGNGFIKILEQGRPFVRNVCFALDQRFHQQGNQTAQFSKSI
jgi:oxygen-independent coproporphyrinogen-3 oxidase